MHQTRYPLPVLHGYQMSGETVARLMRTLAQLSKGKLRAIPNLSSGRIPTLSDAGAVLASLLRHLGSERTIVSAFGLREGLLFQRLDDKVRGQDPLIVAAHEEGRRLGRFPEHGDLLNEWIAPLFESDLPGRARLRHAACLLGDVGWLANPEFRAERGMETALHGNWVAIDAQGRAMLGQALFTCFGGGSDSPDPLTRLADPSDLERAMQWGLAIRLGQRFSGGVAAPLDHSRLIRDEQHLTLEIEQSLSALRGEAVERRLKALAGAFGLTPRIAHAESVSRSPAS